MLMRIGVGFTSSPGSPAGAAAMSVTVLYLTAVIEYIILAIAFRQWMKANARNRHMGPRS
jgi:hypothetical protein